MSAVDAAVLAAVRYYAMPLGDPAEDAALDDCQASLDSLTGDQRAEARRRLTVMLDSPTDWAGWLAHLEAQA